MHTSPTVKQITDRKIATAVKFIKDCGTKRDFVINSQGAPGEAIYQLYSISHLTFYNNKKYRIHTKDSSIIDVTKTPWSIVIMDMDTDVYENINVFWTKQLIKIAARYDTPTQFSIKNVEVVSSKDSAFRGWCVLAYNPDART